MEKTVRNEGFRGKHLLFQQTMFDYWRCLGLIRDTPNNNDELTLEKRGVSWCFMIYIYIYTHVYIYIYCVRDH